MSNANLMTFLIGFGIITLIFGILIILVYLSERPSKIEHHVSCGFTKKDVTYLNEDMLVSSDSSVPELKSRIIK